MEVNLNSMVCHAISDPFAGPNYKLWGLMYMPLLTMFFGKMTTMLYSLFIPLEVKKIN